MPESKGRKKQEYVAPTVTSKTLAPSPRWYAPTMVALMIVGLLWTVVFYLGSSNTRTVPIDGIGAWNLVIGFALIFSGFLMSTRWR